MDLGNHLAAGTDSRPTNDILKNQIEMRGGNNSMTIIPNVIVNDMDWKNRVSRDDEESVLRSSRMHPNRSDRTILLSLASFQNKLQLVQELNQRKNYAYG